MPANVTAEYIKAEQKYLQAKTDEEKLNALHEMLSTAPKHKGSEKLIAEITRKIKKLKERIEKKEIQRRKTSGKSIAVKKEGIGQIAFIGFPNSGKSTILNALTNSELKVASYPFTTKKPEPVMLSFNNALIQLVELPGIIEGSSQGKASGTEFLSVARNADAIALILESYDALNQYRILKKELEQAGIILNKKKPAIKIEKSKFKGITIAGEKFFKGDITELKLFLKAHGFHNSSVLIEEPVTLNDFKDALNPRLVFKPAIAIIVEKYSPLSKESLNSLKKEIDCIVFSKERLEELKEKLFSLLDVILVFTKKPGEKMASKKPLALPKNATIEDAAKEIHKDFAKNLRYARVWGSTKYPGQKVKKDYKLENNDVIELYV